MIGNNETKFPHMLLFTNRQDTSLRNAFTNNLSADVKLSKPQLSKRDFLVHFFNHQWKLAYL